MVQVFCLSSGEAMKFMIKCLSLTTTNRHIPTPTDLSRAYLFIYAHLLKIVGHIDIYSCIEI